MSLRIQQWRSKSILVNQTLRDWRTPLNIWKDNNKFIQTCTSLPRCFSVVLLHLCPVKGEIYINDCIILHRQSTLAQVLLMQLMTLHSAPAKHNPKETGTPGAWMEGSSQSSQ